MISEKGGTVEFQDSIEGKMLAEQTDEATCIARRVVSLARKIKPDTLAGRPD